MEEQQQPLSQQQQQAKAQLLKRASAYEELVRSAAWEHLTEYITGRVKAFTNDALGQGFTSLEEYRERKGEVNGLRSLLGQVEHALQTLEKERSNE